MLITKANKPMILVTRVFTAFLVEIGWQTTDEVSIFTIIFFIKCTIRILLAISLDTCRPVYVYDIWKVRCM